MQQLRQWDLPITVAYLVNTIERLCWKKSGLGNPFTLQKSVQNLGVLSDLGTIRQDDAQLVDKGDTEV